MHDFVAPTVLQSSVVVGLSTWVWTLLYQLTGKCGSDGDVDLRARVVAGVHASAVSALSVLSLMTDGADVFTTYDKCSTPLQYAIAVLTMGYFLYDTGWVIVNELDRVAFYVIHHVICLAGTSLAVYQCCFGTEIAYYLLVNEATNPPTQLKAALDLWGKHREWYAELNFIFIVVSHALCRGVLGTWLVYRALIQPSLPVHAKMVALAIYLLGIHVVKYWLQEAACRYFGRRYDRRRSSVPRSSVMCPE